MDSQKISFVFAKAQNKKHILIQKPQKPNNKVELIKFLEEKEIKLLEEQPYAQQKPLIIPIRDSSKTISERIDDIERNESSVQTENSFNKASNFKDIGETIEQRAAREILNDVNECSQSYNHNKLVVPNKIDELKLKGAIESTIEDYEDVPIQDFGMAMLRGMGWREDLLKTNLKENKEMLIQRPKGMGLGADKVLKRHIPLISTDKNEVLEIKKKAFVRIIGGKNKDLYGQIEGFDDFSTRIIVRFAIGGHTDAVHEFMIQPVSKKEYQEYSKVINSVKYDIYKKLENEGNQIVTKHDSTVKILNLTGKGKINIYDQKETDIKLGNAINFKVNRRSSIVSADISESKNNYKHNCTSDSHRSHKKSMKLKKKKRCSSSKDEKQNRMKNKSRKGLNSDLEVDKKK